MLKVLIIPLVVLAVLFAPLVIMVINMVALAFIIGYFIYKTISGNKGEQQYANPKM